MSIEVQQWRRFRARFMPLRTDDLKPGVADYIGTELEWEPLWVIDEEDGGPYVGEWACWPTDESVQIGWVPACDLQAA
jgi:hypothetical protein